MIRIPVNSFDRRTSQVNFATDLMSEFDHIDILSILEKTRNDC